LNEVVSFSGIGGHVQKLTLVLHGKNPIVPISHAEV
jgi:coproporphyrinogen III oxidase